MGVRKLKFGEYCDKDIYSYILTNNNGLTAEILDYGGIIRKLIYKGIDVCLGYDTMQEYLTNEEYFGAIIGRSTNCIENAEFCLNGKIYKLTSNNGENNHHGGKSGFDKKIWNAEIIDGDEPSLILSLFSPDGEEGFPGNVNVRVIYTLTEDNSIRIQYFGESDSDTVLNMTNHTYFNLNGHRGGKIYNHSLWIDSNFYTPLSEKGFPNGEVLSVRGTPLDFNSESVVGDSLGAFHEQIRLAGGIDHNFVLKGNGYRKVGKVKSDKTGIVMEIYTDRLGMQIYTCNEIEREINGKERALYSKHCGVCFETQAFPNSLKFSHFPSSILKKGEKYRTMTAYKFI